LDVFVVSAGKVKMLQFRSETRPLPDTPAISSTEALNVVDGTTET
jgi:hypothetical protein